LHGGSTPNHVVAARTEQARRDVVTYGLPLDVDPATALLQEVHRTAGHVAWLGAKVAELEAEDLVWGTTQQVDRGSTEFGGTDTTQAAKVSIWLQLYQAERKHLAAVARSAIDAGCNERLVRLAEQQGAQLAEVIRRVADRLLDGAAELVGDEAAGRVRQAWPGLVSRIVPAEIAAVTGGTEPSNSTTGGT
jgi:hypothetical protein